jgi:hypothetical protein
MERGALTAFIEGGFLQAVPDDALRTTVAGIATVQAELDEEREGFQFADERMQTLTLTLDSVDNMIEATDPGIPRSLLRDIVRNPAMRRAVFSRAFSLSSYTQEMRRLRDQLAESLETIEAGLAEAGE